MGIFLVKYKISRKVQEILYFPKKYQWISIWLRLDYEFSAIWITELSKLTKKKSGQIAKNWFWWWQWHDKISHRKWSRKLYYGSLPGIERPQTTNILGHIVFSTWENKTKMSENTIDKHRYR